MYGNSNPTELQGQDLWERLWRLLGLHMRSTWKPQCSISPCYQFCRTGFVKDNLGCETCECKNSALEVICPDITGCNLVCANGRRRDSNNCEACECNPVACPPLQCTQMCTFGRRMDSSGCPTCQCNCLPLSCSLQCPLGLRVNSEGCVVCECRESSDTGDFSLLSCRQSPEMLNCENGKYCGENDENCIECSCFSSDRTRGCENMVTQCRLQCSGGYDTDQNGCEICRCRGSTCPVFDCAVVVSVRVRGGCQRLSVVHVQNDALSADHVSNQSQVYGRIWARLPGVPNMLVQTNKPSLQETCLPAFLSPWTSDYRFWRLWNMWVSMSIAMCEFVSERLHKRHKWLSGLR